MKISSFGQAEKYLLSFTRQGSVQIFQGERGLEKVRYFLSLFGSPQNRLKIIHIAGTAGKGSVCHLISKFLVAHGKKVGLHISPHLVDVRERFQINNKNISKKEFVFYLKKIIPYVQKVEKTEYVKLSYFEVLVGLAFYIFFDKRVDYAVIETGLGGLYDGTNVVDMKDKLSVLTRIGLDHTEILGKTIEEIAYQKAMIINEGSEAIVLDQDKKVNKVFISTAKNKRASITFVTPKLFIRNNRFGSLINRFNSGYQFENFSLAYETVRKLSSRDNIPFSLEKIKKALKTSYFPGRFDIKKIDNKIVILDGAHNPIKMRAFIEGLRNKFPTERFCFLVGFKKGKDFRSMLDCLTPLAKEITVTGFHNKGQDSVISSESPQVIFDYLKTRFSRVKIYDNSQKAFTDVVKNFNGKIVVTGSLYLLGEVYKIIK